MTDGRAPMARAIVALALVVAGCSSDDGASTPATSSGSTPATSSGSAPATSSGSAPATSSGSAPASAPTSESTPTSATPGTAATGTASSDTDPDAAAGEALGIAELLREIPTSAVPQGELIDVRYTDLARASELLGVTPPAATAPDDEVAEWAFDLAGVRVADGERSLVAALLPSSLQAQLGQNTAIREELGWSVVEVDEFIEFVSPPQRVLVASGPTSESVAEVLGQPTDGVWRIGTGEDFAVDPAQRTPARVLGTPVNQATARRLLLMSPSTPATLEGLDGPDGSLADEAGLAAVAAALDGEGVYAAELVRPGEEPSATDTNPFVAMGLGVTLDDTGPLAVLAYEYVDEAAASAAGTALDALVRDGTSAVTGAPWSELFSVEVVATDGTTVVVRLRPADRPLAFVWQIIPAQDSLAARR